jgi:hypothetical protein
MLRFLYLFAFIFANLKPNKQYNLSNLFLIKSEHRQALRTCELEHSKDDEVL